MKNHTSIYTTNYHGFTALMIIFVTFLLSQPCLTTSSIYGVRWSLGDYFSYANLFKIHKTYPKPEKYPVNMNFYTLSFNSQNKLDGDVYVEIGGTSTSCSHRFISIPNSNDHKKVELVPNSTQNSTDFHVYRCLINQDLRLRVPSEQGQIKKRRYCEFPYTIYISQPQFPESSRQKNSSFVDRKIVNIKTTLFQSSFRPPLPMKKNEDDQKKEFVDSITLQKNILVLGDWGIIDEEIQNTRHYIPVRDAVLQRLNSDLQIVLGIFLGDLAYDIINQKYVQTLKYIQPITSKIAFLTSPGNHDYVYHQDSFQLYAQTFLHPNWQKYYNFYYTFILGDILFISWISDDVLADGKLVNVKAIQYLHNELFNNYVRRVGQSESGPSSSSSQTYVGTPDPIYKQYHVVVFSHYPIFCSKANDDLDSCQKNRFRFGEYLNAFTDFKMDVYMSGHLHYYQRTHGICWNKGAKTMTTEFSEGTRQQKQGGVNYRTDVYSSQCPIYLVEGVAGNNYYEQPQGSISPASFASKVSEGTGFGILSYYQNPSKPKQADELHFTHYRMKTKTEIELIDKVIKKLKNISTQKQDTKNQNKGLVYIDTDLMSARLWEMVAVLVLILVGSAICFCYGKKFVGNFGTGQAKKRDDGHAEMVEQNFGPMSSSKDPKSSFETKEHETEIKQMKVKE